jgi:hypothetical protein
MRRKRVKKFKIDPFLGATSRAKKEKRRFFFEF